MTSILLGFFGLSLALSISGVEIFGNLLVLIALWSCFRKENRTQWTASPLDIPLIVYVAWIFTCSILSPTSSFFEVLRKQGPVLFFFVAAHGLKPGELKKVLVWFLIGSSLAGLLGLIQVVLGHSEGLMKILCTRDGRSVGSRSHPLTYAETFIPGFLLILGLLGRKIFIRKESFKSCWKEIMALLVIAAGIVFSQTRGVWLSLFVVSPILLFSWPKKFSLAISGILLASIIVVFAVSPQLRKRAYSITNSTGGNASDLQSNAIRFNLWHESLRTIREHPIVGVGMGGARLTVIDPVTQSDRVWTESHNVYLQQALDGGFIQLGIFVWIIWIMIQSILSIASDWRPVGLSILIAFLVAGLTESWSSDKEITMIFWTFAGVIQNLRLKHTHE